MRADCGDMAENVEAYVVGALDDEDAWALEAHAERCGACLRRVEMARRTSHALALAVPILTPSASLKARVMTGALALRATRPRPRTTWRTAAIAAALALVAVGSLAWGSFMEHRSHALTNENASLREDIAAADARLSALDAQLTATSGASATLSELLAFSDAMLSASAEPDAQSVHLVGTTIAPSADGRYVWSQSRELGALDVRHLPLPADGMTYELRISYANRTVSGGRFTVDTSGRGTLVVHETDATDDDGAALGFAVVVAPSIGTGATEASTVLAGTVPG